MKYNEVGILLPKCESSRERQGALIKQLTTTFL
jgi:hypothetical protein